MAKKSLRGEMPETPKGETSSIASALAAPPNSTP
jgi:hypothetical protein